MIISQLKRPVVFFDRDGTLNEEVGYIRELSSLVLIEGAAEAIKRLNRASVACILVTNQTGAARGYYPEKHIRDLNERLLRLLAAPGAHLDSVYYCPHFKEGAVTELSIDCDCRKPAPGMVKKALSEHQDLDPLRAYVVGDKATDVELARNCNMKGILVETGYGQEVLAGTYQWPVRPDFIAESISGAVDWILCDLSIT